MSLLIQDFGYRLTQLARTATKIKVTIAFLTEEGLSWLPEQLTANVEFIVGIDLGITTPEALKILENKGVNLRVFQEPGKLFHPKALYFQSPEGETLIVGSNNLTGSGISNNHELSLEITSNTENESTFKDFLAHFNFLQAHACCIVPNAEFYSTYKPSQFRNKIIQYSQSQVPLSPSPSQSLSSHIEDARIRTLGEYIKLVAKEFPNLERKKGVPIKNHPLKQLNNDEFHPIFTEIISSVSQGRMTAHAGLNIGGNWFTIPNILAYDETREPWEKTHSSGRLVLQIHYSTDYQKVYLSVVLQYNQKRSSANGEMPKLVAERFRKLQQHLENYSSSADLNGDQFHHWTYKEDFLWGKPLLSFPYRVEALPDDRILQKNLEDLATAVNGMTVIS